MWKKRLSALALTAVMAVSISAPALAAETEAPATREESAALAAQYAAQYGGAVSVQYAVWQDGEITISGHAGVYSKSENRALLDTDLYGIGSVSKIYVTAAVMQLVDQGKIDLDAPVTKYLPDFKMADERYKDITVRMLLNHSSGLMSAAHNMILFADGDRSATEDLLETLSTQRLAADPGAYSVYCNTGFTLAELVVEAVSGKPFPEYLHEAILAPNGLENTFTPQDEFDTSRLVKTYLGEDPRALPQDCLGTVGTGGIYASAADLASFGGLLCSDGLLTSASLDAMAAPEYSSGIWPDDADDILSFGLGWDSVSLAPFGYNDIQALAKGGDTQYYHAGLVIIPEHNMAAAVLTSGGVSTYNEMAAARMLIDALAEQGVAVDETVPSLPQAARSEAMPAEVMDYSGYYASTLQQFKVDISAGGVLTLQSLTVPSSPAQTFYYFDDGSFRDETGAAAMVKPVVEENGEIYLWQKAYAFLPGLTVLPTSNYVAQKVEPAQLAEDVQAAWDKWNTTSVLPLNEKYTSQVWLSLGTASAAELPEYIPGYVGAQKIVDSWHSQFAVQVPGNAGRDGSDITITEQDGHIWMDAQGLLYADASIAQPIYCGAGAYSTIQPDGYARWYTVDSAAGLTIQVEIEGSGGFYVYDGAGALTASSVVWGDSTVTLPEGGSIAFAGDAGTRFHISVVPAV
ncbi:serine hydrolase [uncultured Pseudoflavonifractor sp.]|uniref:serine hydrolase domain-containing protein n=1 Tax=uncultured Pseudoflavonifractor sp. TaxID=1221379 RepID=UPI0025E02FFD|nr:serine hydrolase domain-containing protein [uncultured Pseudoflavonifractor sp.]